MNSIEEKLWNYIDGSCTPEDEHAIALLIEQDEVYRKKYNELVLLNAEFTAMELDEPPMAFTYNVMETIRAEHASQPLKAAIDQRIIKGIGLFFVFTISIILIVALASIHWSAIFASSSHTPSKIALPDLRNLFTGPVMKGFLFFDVVLGLYLFDTYLRKKGLAKANNSVQTTGQQKQQ
ncbi:hypothetical protein SAMN05216490_3829 [Mucilaginibacter mallensis]|uniref:Zinc-finger n=1 Tax=Mucilaginibacter mallensis TaxID=652787 RepID=A0A1H2B037_MUCMA|nr:hypothetical protein [Mucilaginibacter mallensis]SDT51551.1 hypothetical protein SAMN05216490_3829 [Mucilaginibacter mallensis]